MNLKKKHQEGPAATPAPPGSLSSNHSFLNFSKTFFSNDTKEKNLFIRS